MKRKILFFLIILVTLILSYIYVMFEKKYTYDTTLEINENKPLKYSLDKLPISKTLYFKLYLKYRNEGRNIKAGYYEIKGNYNIRDLVSILESGKSKMYKFTIIEGSTVKNVIDKLVAEGKGNRENFLKVLEEIEFPYPTPNKNFEGYFYPETYLISEKSDEKTIIEVFLKEFLKKFPEDKYKNKDEFYEKLIMASILEREAMLDKEKPLMASVFYNRIKKGMTLSADSTVNFIYNYEKRRILYKDLEIESLYNTYKNKGLPPAPICNPAESSLLAAYNPAKTDYLFFVSVDGREHFFSKTYKEHLEYQRKGRKLKEQN